MYTFLTNCFPYHSCTIPLICFSIGFEGLKVAPHMLNEVGCLSDELDEDLDHIPDISYHRRRSGQILTKYAEILFSVETEIPA
jgi:hypothetical protein